MTTRKNETAYRLALTLQITFRFLNRPIKMLANGGISLRPLAKGKMFISVLELKIDGKCGLRLARKCKLAQVNRNIFLHENTC